jgi:hypothetical protein
MYQKYLKYKYRYLSIKGGSTRIYNYSNYDKVSTSEVISYEDLKEQMTNHGLGSGIYGFLNRENASGSVYESYKYINSLEMKNCLVLRNEWIEDGERRSDLTSLTSLSMFLNSCCYEIYTKKINKSDIISFVVQELPKNGLILDNDKLYLRGLFDISLDEIVKTITDFLFDYNKLMSESPELENYIVMPINYLLHERYDGICNYINDSGGSGSVFYEFPYLYARSFVATKKSKILKGKLIFKGHVITQ